MRRVATCVFALTTVALVALMFPQPAVAADAPADRVVVMYFHRVPGCATCQKMAAYSEEAVKKGFAKDVKDGKVEFYTIDFEDANNAALVRGYKISGPALIVAKVAAKKVAEYKNLTEIWSKVGDKPAFIEYVQTNVKDCQK